MLGDRYTGAHGKECGRRGNVDRRDCAAAGTAGVDQQVRPRMGHAAHRTTQRPHRPGDLGGRLTLGAKREQQLGNQRCGRQPRLVISGEHRLGGGGLIQIQACSKPSCGLLKGGRARMHRQNWRGHQWCQA